MRILEASNLTFDAPLITDLARAYRWPLMDEGRFPNVHEPSDAIDNDYASRHGEAAALGNNRLPGMCRKGHVGTSRVDFMMGRQYLDT